jgi:cell division protein ZapB
MTEEKFESLNSKVDALINLCGEIKQENQALKASEHKWHSERSQLTEKNKEAKTELEAILGRLKSLGQP